MIHLDDGEPPISDIEYYRLVRTSLRDGFWPVHPALSMLFLVNKEDKRAMHEKDTWCSHRIAVCEGLRECAQ